MSQNFEGPYVIEHGDVWWLERNSTPGGRVAGLGRRHVCNGTQMVAVAFDAEDGILHKHGMVDGVERWADEARRKFREGGFAEMADAIVVLSFLPTIETIQELNACIATSGRVLHLESAMQRLLEENPELSRLPIYPRV